MRSLKNLLGSQICDYVDVMPTSVKELINALLEAKDDLSLQQEKIIEEIEKVTAYTKRKESEIWELHFKPEAFM